LYLGDQLGRRWIMSMRRPGRRFSCGVPADLVGGLSNKL
jgi:hypothetical protein